MQSKPATILLNSSSLANKGDALMLKAVVNHFGPQHRYAIPANCAFASPSAAKDFALRLSTDRPAATKKRKLFEAVVVTLEAATRAIPPRIREKLNIVREDDVDIVVDLSGYCYGDHWGESLINKAIRQYSRYKRRGKPIILMPKTWGPFNNIPRQVVESLVDTVDIAFARDEQSLAILKSCLSDANARKIFFAPDYTHQVGSQPPPSELPDVRNAPTYIIPSYRVIDSGTLERERYFRLLARARTLLQSRGARPVLLIHETASDHAFQRAAHSMGFIPDETIQEDDPVRLKAIISESAGVVTSRLHGLYNALNSCVPVLSIPWNFKYEQALRQYSCEELLVDIIAPEASLDAKIDLLLLADERVRISKVLADQRARMQQLTSGMWERIDAVLTDHLAL